MNTVKQLEKDIQEMDLSGLLTDSLPPIQQWMQDKLTRMGGTHFTGKPNYRIISGLDPKIQEFAFGKWHRKYVSVIDTVKEISAIKTIQRTTYQTKLWSIADAIKANVIDQTGTPTPFGKKFYNIILLETFTEIEYGVPRYIIERYRSPEEFGSPEEWEKSRYDTMTGKPIDVYGEFPSQGRYDFFCNYEDGIEENGKITRTTFKPLTEEGIEQIADLIEMASKPASEVIQMVIEKADAMKLKKEEKAMDDIEYGIKSNIGRLTNMPSNIRKIR